MTDASRPAASAEPVCYGINTVVAQYEDTTPWSATREVFDNALGVSANLAADAPKVGVAAYLQQVTTRKGSGPAQPARMFVQATKTHFDSEAWKDCFRLVNPKKNEERTHVASVHGQGMSNATIGLGKRDYSGQCLAVRRVARAPEDPLAAMYPVEMSVQRFGEHADHVLAKRKESADVRGTLRGDLLVYPDKRTKDKVSYPYAAAYVGSGNYAPATIAEFNENILGPHVQQTTQDLLDHSPWAPDLSELPHPCDLCDALLESIDEALRNMAEVVGISFEEAFASDCVIYFFWDVRDEIWYDPDTGSIKVGEELVHERLANTYLPCTDNPTREYLKDVAPVPDPLRLEVAMGEHTVDFKAHWLLKKLHAESGALPELRPWSFANGQGKDKRVYVGDGFTVESYIPKATFFPVQRDLLNECATVVLHAASGLSIGDRDAFTNNKLFKNSSQLQACTQANIDLYSKVMGKHSIKNWVGATTDAEKKNMLAAGILKLVPEAHKWAEAELREIHGCINRLFAIHEQNPTKDGAGVVAKQKYETNLGAWLRANPQSTAAEQDEKKYELACKAGAQPLSYVLNKVCHILTGQNVVHVVTIHNDDLALDKPKAAILGETPTLLALCAAIPRINKEIMTTMADQICEWRSEDLAREKAELERKAREEREEKRRQEQLKKAGEAEQKKRKERELQEAQKRRMKALGVFPRRSGKLVSFISLDEAGKKEQIMHTMCKELAQQQLRKGTLYMPEGRGKGKYFIFKGADPTQGNLFTTTGKCNGSETEIVENKKPPQKEPARPKPVRQESLGPTTDPGANEGRRARLTPPSPAIAAIAAAGRAAGIAAANAASTRIVVATDPDAPPKLLPFLMNMDDNYQFAFSVPENASPTFISELTRLMHNPMIEPFVAAMRTQTRLRECLADEGGLKLTLARGQVSTLRIVPVLQEASRRKDEARRTEVVGNGANGKQVVVYLDVLNFATGTPADLNKEMTTAYIAHKIATVASKAYSKELRTSNYNVLGHALIGYMTMPSWDTLAGVQDVKAISTVVPASLGKRRAPDEPEVKEEPAQRPRTEAAPLAPVPSAYAIEEMD